MFFTLEGRAHLRWVIKKLRADLADRTNSAFCYVHPFVGRFVYHPSDWLSRRLWLYGDFEAREVRYAIHAAKRGGLILDVGANIGLYAVVCARAVRGQGRVLAFEPGVRTFEKLETTLGRLKLGNVVPLRTAVGPENGVARFLDSHNGMDVHQRLGSAASREGFQPVNVPIQRLDDLCGDEVEDVTLMKLDIEGHEIGALMGAEKILANGHVKLIVEFNPERLAEAGATVKELWDYLERTHLCTMVVGQDGAEKVPAAEALTAMDRQEMVNTFWAPRAATLRR